MARERIEVEVVAITGQAVDNVDELKIKIDELNEAKEKSKKLEEESQQVTANQSKIIRLFDQATGGAVTRIKSLVEGVKALVVETKALTAAQLKANLAFLANPWAIAAAGIAAATAGFVGFVQYATDSAVPVLTTLKNTFLSLGNAQRFAALQGAALVTEQTKEQVSEVEGLPEMRITNTAFVSPERGQGDWLAQDPNSWYYGPLEVFEEPEEGTSER